MNQILALSNFVKMVYLLIVATGAAITGGVIAYNRIRLYISGEKSQAIFVGWESRGVGVQYHYQIIRFRSNSGSEHTVISGVGNKKKVERKNITVIYLPQSPQEAMIYSIIDFWAAPLIFISMSLVAAITAFL